MSSKPYNNLVILKKLVFLTTYHNLYLKNSYIILICYLTPKDLPTKGCIFLYQIERATRKNWGFSTI